MIDENKILEKLKVNIALSNLENEIKSNSNDKNTLKNKIFVRLYKMKRKFAEAIIVAILLMSGLVFAHESLFSLLNEDNLSLKAEYKGNGKVAIYVENKSDKELKFENKIKLMRWSTSEEIPRISNNIKFKNTNFEPSSKGTMLIDLSKAYDLSLIEKPLELEKDHYYFVLTNNNFIFGQDWHCTIDFVENQTQNESLNIESNTGLNVGSNSNSNIEDVSSVSTVKIPKNETTSSNTNLEIIEELQPFFDEYVISSELRNKKISEYYQKVEQIIQKEIDNGKNIISPVNPHLFVKDPDKSIIFDSRIQNKLQYQLILEHHLSIDAYNIPIGKNDFEECMILSTTIPHYKKDINSTGGAILPLVYIYQYEVKEMHKPNTFAFIRGRLLSANDLEAFKVYQDEKYVCYDLTDLFYDNLETYIDTYTKNRTDIYIDEGVMTRIKNVYNYLRNKENLSNSFYYYE